MASKLDELKASRAELEESKKAATGDELGRIQYELLSLDIAIADEKISIFSMIETKGQESGNEVEEKRGHDGAERFSKEWQDLVSKKQDLDLRDEMKEAAEVFGVDLPGDFEKMDFGQMAKVLKDKSGEEWPRVETPNEVESFISEWAEKNGKVYPKLQDLDYSISYFERNKDQMPKKYEVSQEQIDKYSTAHQEFKAREGERFGPDMSPGAIYKRSIAIQEARIKALDAGFGTAKTPEARIDALYKMRDEAKTLRSYQAQYKDFQVKWNDDGTAKATVPVADKPATQADTPEKKTESRKEGDHLESRPDENVKTSGQSEASKARYVLWKYSRPVSMVLHAKERADAVKVLTDHKIQEFERSKRLSGESVQLTPADRKTLEKMVKIEVQRGNQLERMETFGGSIYKSLMRDEYTKEWNSAAQAMSRAQNVQKEILGRSIRPDMVLVAIDKNAVIQQTGSPALLQKAIGEAKAKAGGAVEYKIITQGEAAKIGAKAPQKPAPVEQPEKAAQSRKVRA